MSNLSYDLKKLYNEKKYDQIISIIEKIDDNNLNSKSCADTIKRIYAGLFIELKNSALFLVSFNFELTNSIASIVPIGAIILLNTFIF